MANAPSSPAESTEFVAKDRVVAAHDLDGVPEGTPGRVVMVTGLSWIRYRVAFENGVELGLLDGKHLTSAPRAGSKRRRPATT